MTPEEFAAIQRNDETNWAEGQRRRQEEELAAILERKSLDSSQLTSWEVYGSYSSYMAGSDY